mgnify:CR=1 FL=1
MPHRAGSGGGRGHHPRGRARRRWLNRPHLENRRSGRRRRHDFGARPRPAAEGGSPARAPAVAAVPACRQRALQRLGGRGGRLHGAGRPRPRSRFGGDLQLRTRRLRRRTAHPRAAGRPARGGARPAVWRPGLADTAPALRRDRRLHSDAADGGRRHRPPARPPPPAPPAGQRRHRRHALSAFGLPAPLVAQRRLPYGLYARNAAGAANGFLRRRRSIGRTDRETVGAEQCRRARQPEHGNHVRAAVFEAAALHRHRASPPEADTSRGRPSAGASQ